MGKGIGVLIESLSKQGQMRWARRGVQIGSVSKQRAERLTNRKSKLT